MDQLYGEARVEINETAYSLKLLPTTDEEVIVAWIGDGSVGKLRKYDAGGIPLRGNPVQV